MFALPEILAGKEYHRMVTSGLLHANWNHLALNMVSLLLLGRPLEIYLGAAQFLLIYLAAILGGSLLSLWIHRHHEYKAYGASGGVCGVVFSYVLLAPNGNLGLFLLPVAIPAWLYAILYFVGSFVAMKRDKGNIGHDAHLGGAIIGFWTTAALNPDLVRVHPRIFLAISSLAVLLFVYLVKNPLMLPMKAFLPVQVNAPAAPTPRPKQVDNTATLDAILEKISKSGVQSLSPKEKSMLDEASKRMRQQRQGE
jgi:membrane associated rhomboid family serine protease